MRRVLLAVGAVAIAASVAAPAVAAAGCPSGFFARGTGVYSPLSGREITYCWPIFP